jgi:hypothetical protein
LRAAFESITGQLASLAPGTPIDSSRVADPGAQSIVRGLAMDARPLPEWAEMGRRVKLRRLDAQMDELESKLPLTEEGSPAHSELLRELIALQQEKRTLGHD